MQKVTALGHRGVEVRRAEDLNDCHGLILPGGESTTIGMLLRRRGLDRAIAQKIRGGLPVFGTCAGMILLAKTVTGRCECTFEVLDIEVERNAYGSQIESFESSLIIDTGRVPPYSFTAIFIRAPRITYCSDDVRILSEFENSPVMIQQNNILACGFHPELTSDTRIHEFFINDLCRDYTPEIPEAGR